MARKKHEEEHENHERWLVSYADFITLLFAFFTVLYATAQTDQQKLEAVIDGLNAAFDGGMPRALLDAFAADDGSPPDTPGIIPNHLTMESADPVMQSLKRNLAGSLSDNVVQIGLLDQTLTLVLPDRMLFAPGSADLHPAAYPVLGEIASVLADQPVVIEVIGHADGTPIKGGAFGDNWGLASARSLAAIRYLEKRGVAVDRLVGKSQVSARADPLARAVTMRVFMAEPGPAGEVVDRLEKIGKFQ